MQSGLMVSALNSALKGTGLRPGQAGTLYCGYHQTINQREDNLANCDALASYLAAVALCCSKIEKLVLCSNKDVSFVPFKLVSVFWGTKLIFVAR